MFECRLIASSARRMGKPNSISRVPGAASVANLEFVERASDWHVAPGTYELHVGRSSADVAHVVSVER